MEQTSIMQIMIWTHRKLMGEPWSVVCGQKWQCFIYKEFNCTEILKPTEAKNDYTKYSQPACVNVSKT